MQIKCQCIAKEIKPFFSPQNFNISLCSFNQECLQRTFKLIISETTLKRVVVILEMATSKYCLQLTTKTFHHEKHFKYKTGPYRRQHLKV